MDGKVILVVIVGLLIYGTYVNPTFFADLQSKFGIAPVNSTYVAPINQPPSGTQTIRVAFWNLGVFGQAKSANEAIMTAYTDEMRNYDAIFVVEIRDISGVSFKRLCDRMPGYRCIASPPKGGSLEQYGAIVRENYNLTSNELYGAFERVPTLFVMMVNNQSYDIIVQHIKPDNAEYELRQLDLVAQEYKTRDNVYIGGDFNSDCSYMSNYQAPSGYVLGILNSADTTATASDCAYDRILYEEGLPVIATGVSKNTGPEVSDHYPVFVKVAQ